MGIVWLGYSLGLWGYCLVRGIDVKLSQLVNPVHPFDGLWAPGLIPGTMIFPDGSSGTGAAAKSGPGSLQAVGQQLTAPGLLAPQSQQK
jgi:hypothetical protein